MSSVVITVTPPGGSPQDITDSVIFGASSFQSQFNGVPGSFDISVRDPSQTLSFATGWEIQLTVDTVTMFGGYITQVGMTSLAPAADTSDLGSYDLRTWHLSGADYNIALDRRIYRDTGDYLTSIRINEVIDGQILTSAIENYADMDDFSTAGIDDVATIPDIDHVTIQQGWVVRKEFETLLPFSGAVYYIDGDKTIVWKAYDDAEKRWGFSDTPNSNPITASPDAYQGALYGFSQVEGTQDSTMLANDIFVWGGSEFAGSGGTVFHRSTDTTSIDDHGRWQHPETHFGESMFKSTAGVTAVADAILNGPPGTDATGQEKGLKRPQWQFDFTWFSNRVPELSGVRDHIRAGDLVTINLAVFGVTRLLPVRNLRISFPDAFEDDNTHLVQFDGTFGLQLSDSFTLWRYILQNQNRIKIQTQAVVTDDSTETTPGAVYPGGVPEPAPDGTTTVFTIPFAYISGTTQVYLNGILQRVGIDYTESNPNAGEITFTSAPLVTDTINVVAYTQATTSGNALPPAPTPTVEYTGDGSDLESFIAGQPDGTLSSRTVIGLETGADLVIGSGNVNLAGRNNLTIVGRGATIRRTSQVNNTVLLIDGGGSNISLYSVNVQSAKSEGTYWELALEHEHGIGIGGITNFLATDCNVNDVGGEGYHIDGGANRWSDTVRFTGGTVHNVGRMGWAITDGGSHVSIDNNHFEEIGYYTGDIEPNGATVDGRTAGGEDVMVSNNTTGNHPYGLLTDPNPVAGVFFAATGASGGGPAKRVSILSNIMSDGWFTAIAFNNGVTCQNFVISGNQGADSFTGDDNGWDHALIMSSVAGLTITGNTQICSPTSDFESHSGSTGVTISGNTVS